VAKGLTKKQKLIYQFVMDYLNKNGYPPSIREIGSEFEIASLRGVTVHLDALAKKGFIERTNTPRSIRLTNTADQVVGKAIMAPYLGPIAAGRPIEALEDNHECIPIPAEFARNSPNTFVLRIQGESMIGDGIMPDDLIIVRPQPTAQNHEIVAATLEHEGTVKRYRQDGRRTYLESSNPAFAPIDVTGREDFRIIGKVVGLIRDYGNNLI
jgi:repressor LexA